MMGFSLDIILLIESLGMSGYGLYEWLYGGKKNGLVWCLAGVVTTTAIVLELTAIP
jgi:hypothetical protein